MFGRTLARLRKERKMSQYDLAEKMNFSRGKIANYEQGTRQPDFETLQMFADFFEVSTDYLLGRTNEPNGSVKTEEEEFEAFKNDPELNVFYKELPQSDAEAVRKLRDIWEIIKREKK